MNGTIGATWEGLDADAIARRCGVARVELLGETDSTQDVAHAAAEHGTPAGTLIVADAQRAGRGRMGRSWTSQPGAGVWCTIVERPADPLAIELLSIRVGLECARALDRFAGKRVGVKWPNDLVIPGEARDLHFSKLGGILVEARWSGATLGWVAIGVGVNVRTPENVADAAGMVPGTLRLDVLPAIVRAARAAAARVGQLHEQELSAYRERDVLAGRWIASPGVGTVIGINAGGALVVQTARGQEQFRSGTVLLSGESAEGAP